MAALRQNDEMMSVMRSQRGRPISSREREAARAGERDGVDEGASSMVSIRRELNAGTQDSSNHRASSARWPSAMRASARWRASPEQLLARHRIEVQLCPLSVQARRHPVVRMGCFLLGVEGAEVMRPAPGRYPRSPDPASAVESNPSEPARRLGLEDSAAFLAELFSAGRAEVSPKLREAQPGALAMV
jgi:hypothetical protein